MTIIYLKPAATGTGTGTDWNNANTMANFAAVYTARVPGDEIWLSSEGTHTKTGTTTLTNANNPTAALPIRVRGMMPIGTIDGYPRKATIIGSRTAPHPYPNIGGGTGGGTLFDHSTGAKYTRWENLVALNQDIGWRLLTTDNIGIEIEDCEAINVRAGFSCGVTTSNLRIRRLTVVGFTLYGVYVGADSSDIVVEDCEVSQLGYDDNLTNTAPRGFMLDVSAHNARIRRCTAVGGFDFNATYWNGDGFTSEEDCYDVIYEDCYASDWPDGGWDTKASGNILRRCVSERNSRNYRSAHQRVVGWIGPHIYEDCVSRYPVYRGGTGSDAHLTQAAGVPPLLNRLTWRSGLIESHDSTTEVILTSTDCEATFTKALIRKHPMPALVEGPGVVTFTDCVTETEA